MELLNIVWLFLFNLTLLSLCMFFGWAADTVFISLPESTRPLIFAPVGILFLLLFMAGGRIKR